MTTLKIAAALAVLIVGTTFAEAKQLKKYRTQGFAWGQEYQGDPRSFNPQYQQPTTQYFGGGQYDAQVVEHPPGCPRRAFCGCGVSVKVFGRPVKDLFLAANWLRKFPRATPGPGMVAARRGHVMYIMSTDANGNATVYDPNSGRHQTRIHTRSLAGYVVVNPHSSL